MANTVLNKALTTSSSFFLFFFFFFFSFFIQTKQENPCPYPCYPPPTGTGGGGGSGGGGTVTQTPPASYSPPAQTGVYTPPTENLPYYPQPPPYGGNSFYGQPPPDPILPYFPYYSRKPPHQTDNQSSGTTVRPGKSIFIVTVTTNLLVFIILVVYGLGNY